MKFGLGEADKNAHYFPLPDIALTDFLQFPDINLSPDED